MSGIPTDYAERLMIQWNIIAKHGLYHEEGTWYMPLKSFPGALIDRNGYIIFNTAKDYLNSWYLNIGERVNVCIRSGISQIPGYKKFR